MTDDSELASLLAQIRDNQREALALQREQMTLYRQQLDRADRIQSRAETLQARAGTALKAVLWVALPLLGLLLALMLWPWLRQALA